MLSLAIIHFITLSNVSSSYLQKMLFQKYDYSLDTAITVFAVDSHGSTYYLKKKGD